MKYRPQELYMSVLTAIIHLWGIEPVEGLCAQFQVVVTYICIHHPVTDLQLRQGPIPQIIC